MKFKIEYLLLILIFILFFQITAPLFSSNYHLNIDSPAHYLRIWCLDQEGVAPSNWCPHINAGNPTSQYYYPIIDQFIVLFGKIIGLTLAYNVVVALSLLATGVGSYALLKSRGYKIAPVLALGLNTLYYGSWHFGGLSESILVGFWHYTLSIGFLFLGLLTFINLLEKPSKKNLIIAALCSMFFTHPMTIILGVFLYASLIISYRKSIFANVKIFSKFVVLSLLLNAYYIVPLATRTYLFIVQPGGGYFWSDIMVYAGSSFNWYFILFVPLGCLMLFFSKKSKPIISIFAALLIIFLIQFFDTPIRTFLPGIRTLAILAPMYWMLIALGVEFLANITPKPICRWIGWILAVALILLNFSTISDNNIITSENPAFDNQLKLYTEMKQLPQGRVLAEETLYNMATPDGMLIQSFTHSASMIPVLSGHEILTFGTYLFPKDSTRFWNVDKGRLWGKQIEEWDKVELNKIFEKHNVKYIVTHSPQWIKFLANFTKPIGKVDNFVVLETSVPRSWFVTDANITIQKYEHWRSYIHLIAEETTVLTQKSNWYPTWTATIDGEKVEVRECDTSICITIPKGSHEVKFYHSLTKVDWFGWLLTMTGIFAILFIYKKQDF